jgi:hypothetical protein
MNIIDKLYTEWAWRTTSGTPDINNPEDKFDPEIIPVGIELFVFDKIPT